VSTIALAFYFYVVSQGKTTQSQNQLMHLVYTILRVGMVLVLCGELALLVGHCLLDNNLYWQDNPALWMRCTVFFVIVANAVAMQWRKVSMWVGPVLAGGSWYGYFFFGAWPSLEQTYLTMFMGYLGWLVVFGAILTVVRILLTRSLNETSNECNVVVSPQ